ncbi:NAD(P)-binding protein [Myriangium duriaei CBS 260.36]|uniref:NAD(P)-binding protein n=1 Tax=Myriangium duriaei CBS 260.36 TaxID=1168546 RepID=A0A9P4MF17_9PEZI|nr:NAD(P)-binding protein [Myriangium duriaei CBS 260.36]
MPFPYKKVLLLGATSGIGEALAVRMIQHKVHVIIAGRRTANLEKLVQTHGSDLLTPITVDISDLQSLPSFASSITKDHPDLDCVFINSGIQRGLDFADPSSIDLSLVGKEFTTNYLSYVHLTVAFLPFFQKQDRQTSFIYTSSGLALVPLLRCSNYCASKAALHHWILCLREQLKNGPGNIKVIEVFPPAVQTELHDEKHQPDIKNGRQFGMPLDKFTNEAWAGLDAEHDEVAVEMARNWYDQIEPGRQKAFQQMLQRMAGAKK